MAHDNHTPGAVHQDAHGDLGHDGQPHGHHIMSAGSLLAILLILLALTGLTVYTAKEWHLGLLGNASLAIAIATVKCTLVAMYFMHLRYDNHFYAVALIACVLAVVLFLYGTMKDLNTRSAIDPIRNRLLLPVPEDKVALARYDAIGREGRTLFLANCASCHGSRAEGVPDPDAFYGDSRPRLGPSLIRSGFVRSNPDPVLAKFIIDGREKNDPASVWGISHAPKGGNPALTDEQALKIVAFIRAAVGAADTHGGAAGGHGEAKPAH